MIHRICSWLEFASEIKENNKKIVMFGCGLIGQIIIPQILKQHGLLPYVCCMLDNDARKWGSEVDLCGMKMNIEAPERLELCDKNTIIFLNISRFESVYNQLIAMPCTDSMQLFITPMMLIYNCCEDKSKGLAKISEKPLIPKKIHYMWLGNNPMPDKLGKCLDSWKKYCPDYEIIKWSEENYDIKKNSYIAEAYEKKAYAFVSDFARLDILYNHGGIYMDTDVELIRNLDDMLYQEAFCGVEKWQDINFGTVCGSVPGNKALFQFIKSREGLKFIDKDGNENRTTCGFYDTQAALKSGYVINGMTQYIENINIYAYDYFSPYDYMSGKCTITDNTYAIHWYNGGWLDEESRLANEKTKASFDELYEKCQKNTLKVKGGTHELKD